MDNHELCPVCGVVGVGATGGMYSSVAAFHTAWSGLQKGGLFFWKYNFGRRHVAGRHCDTCAAWQYSQNVGRT